MSDIYTAPVIVIRYGTVREKTDRTKTPLATEGRARGFGCILVFQKNRARGSRLFFFMARGPPCQPLCLSRLVRFLGMALSLGVCFDMASDTQQAHIVGIVAEGFGLLLCLCRLKGYDVMTVDTSYQQRSACGCDGLSAFLAQSLGALPYNGLGLCPTFVVEHTLMLRPVPAAHSHHSTPIGRQGSSSR